MLPSRQLPPQDLDFILDKTRGLWEEARGKSFFITGGTGFFGMWLLESFTHVNDALGLEMSATVLTRDPVRFAAKAPHLTSRTNLHFVAGDIRNFQFPRGKFEYFIHAATEASAKLNNEAPQEMLETIVTGTRRVLEFAAQAGVRKLLLTSSGAVYGRQPSDLTHIPEEYAGAPDPLLPSSAYGEGKRVSEHLCAVHAIRHGYELKVARCFAFVGPHLPLDTHFAIGNFIRDAMAGQPIAVGGDGTPMRSYLYTADLAIWLWTLLFRAASARAYNVGSAADLSIADLAHKVSEVLGGGSIVTIKQKPSPEKLRERYVPSIHRAEEELGLSSWTPMRDAIHKTYCWHQTSQQSPA
jgi:dTDP-glucose 4,6-dehydratase